jgi:hypothetical protein
MRQTDSINFTKHPFAVLTHMRDMFRQIDGFEWDMPEFKYRAAWSVVSWDGIAIPDEDLMLREDKNIVFQGEDIDSKLSKLDKEYKLRLEMCKKSDAFVERESGNQEQLGEEQ